MKLPFSFISISSDSMLVPGALAILIITITAIYFFYQHHKDYVLETSIALKKAAQLSEKYYFHPIEESYTYTKRQNNLAAYRRINYQVELINYVKSRQPFFEDCIKKANENRSTYENYINEFNDICNTNTTTWKYNFQKRFEKELLNRAKLTPVCCIQIKIKNEYMSPKGRNYYCESRTFEQNQIQNAFTEISKQSTFEASKQAERSKMNDSLRYDILKRDGFRCQICGASAKDGVTLHVDHIVPVSKGGKTVKSNLRTLCSNCNLGKGAKFDPNGPN